MRRAWRAFRRGGIGALLDGLRRRWRAVAGRRTAGRAAADALRLLGRPSVLARRIRYALFQISYPDSHQIEAALEAHPWTRTFAHDAAFNPFFDLSAETLEANRAIVEGFEERPQEVRSATWFLTYFDHALFGGVYTILRLMSFMKTRHGVEHRLVLFDRSGVSDGEVRRTIAEAFPDLVDIDVVLPVKGRLPFEELPPTDIALCGLWISAYPLARFEGTRAKFYLVQDFEPAFYPAGTLSALAEATYRLGFAGIVNTPGLAEVYRSYGNPVVEFVPGVDRVADSLDKPSQEGDPVQVVVYGRPSTDRNAFELVASACKQLKERYRDHVRVVSAGEDWDPADLGLEGILENRGRLTSLEAVHDLYRASDIGVCFMLSKHPSYQPFEYLASYVVPVCNVNEATRWFLRDGENCLITEPFPSEIARTVGRLVEDTELRHKIAQAGHDEVAGLEWEGELERIWRFVTNPE